MNQPVWVADDNLAVAESLVALLASVGIVACAVGDPMARLCLGEQPALLILDLRMPFNGHLALKEITLHPEWTFPVVVLSGYAEEAPRDVTGRVFATLPKTVSPSELIAVVRRALGQSI